MLSFVFRSRFLEGIDVNNNEFWGSEIDLSLSGKGVKRAHSVSLHIYKYRMVQKKAKSPLFAFFFVVKISVLNR